MEELRAAVAQLVDRASVAERVLQGLAVRRTHSLLTAEQYTNLWRQTQMFVKKRVENTLPNVDRVLGWLDERVDELERERRRQSLEMHGQVEEQRLRLQEQESSVVCQREEEKAELCRQLEELDQSIALQEDSCKALPDAQELESELGPLEELRWKHGMLESKIELLESRLLESHTSCETAQQAILEEQETLKRLANKRTQQEAELSDAIYRLKKHKMLMEQELQDSFPQDVEKWEELCLQREQRQQQLLRERIEKTRETILLSRQSNKEQVQAHAEKLAVQLCHLPRGVVSWLVDEMQQHRGLDVDITEQVVSQFGEGALSALVKCQLVWQDESGRGFICSVPSGVASQPAEEEEKEEGQQG